MLDAIKAQDTALQTQECVRLINRAAATTCGTNERRNCFPARVAPGAETTLINSERGALQSTYE